MRTKDVDYQNPTTTQQIKPRTTTTFRGWLIMLRRTILFRPASKSSQEQKRYKFVWLTTLPVFSKMLATLFIFVGSVPTCVWLGVWDAEGGGGKTGAESAAVHGYEINTAFDLYMYPKEHHSQVTNSYHEALHQVDKRKFHYLPRGTFLAYHPRRWAHFFYHRAPVAPTWQFRNLAFKLHTCFVIHSLSTQRTYSH